MDDVDRDGGMITILFYGCSFPLKRINQYTHTETYKNRHMFMKINTICETHLIFVYNIYLS